MRFQLLAGLHTEPDPSNPPYGELTYKAGDVFESNTDLCQRFNRDGSTKFQRLSDAPSKPQAAVPVPSSNSKPIPVPEPTPPSKLKVNLDVMTLEQLQKFAEDEEIDIKGAKKREEVLRAVKSAVLAS